MGRTACVKGEEWNYEFVQQGWHRGLSFVPYRDHLFLFLEEAFA